MHQAFLRENIVTEISSAIIIISTAVENRSILHRRGHITFVSEKRVHTEEQKAIIQAFKDAWGAYRQYAWGHDEFHPITKKFSEWFGVGLTILDSLDTAIIMGLKKGIYICNGYNIGWF